MVQALSAHAAAGRLDVAELESRVEQVLTAATREEARPALADLPPLPATSTASGPSVAPDWQPTPERFRDPRSGRITRVWVDAGGARHYVAE
jgi:hypothetical protein